MARHLTRWLKPTLLVPKYWRVGRVYMPAILMNSDSIVEKVSSKIEPRNVEYDESKYFDRLVENFNYGQDIAVSTIIELLGISKSSAEKTVWDHPSLKYMPKQQICNNYKILRAAGFRKWTIKNNEYLLVGDSTVLKQKITLLKQIDIEINDGAYLLCLSLNKLVKFERMTKMDATYLPVSNRIQYLAKKLDCATDKMCQLLVYNPYMLKLTGSKILSKTELMLKNGITPKAIKNDLWAYNYHIRTIENKIERANKAGIKPLKPWVIRCTETVWKKVEERFHRHEAIFENGESIQQHLSEIFQCDLQSVDTLFEYNPILHSVDFLKLSKIARLLYSRGYTIANAQRVPIIFQRSYETLEERFKEWEEAGNTDPPKLSYIATNLKRFKLLCKLPSSNLPK